MSQITGEHLRLARILYGFKSQEQLADAMGVTMATVNRYESMDNVDAKVLGQYLVQMEFDIEGIFNFVSRLRQNRG